ncbi:unnamed protein product [Toxocara canis]|uniref:Uncharacterized protein n=1 Tax=Toxocara canis TaxID=6265 RepID=A0A183VDY7_TOXCA|nr:unnamed protein product [Toxocara canis]
MERRWKQPQSLREPHRSSSVLECRRKTEHTKKSSSSLSNEGLV